MKKALLLSALLLATLACSLDLGFTPPDLPQSEAPAQSSGYAQKNGHFTGNCAGLRKLRQSQKNNLFKKSVFMGLQLFY